MNRRWKGRRGGNRGGFRRFPQPQNRGPRPRNVMPYEKLQENEVGITEFMSPNLETFSGIIKSRYSDFHVNEIDIDGGVAKLTDTNVPEEFRSKKKDRIDIPEESPTPHISEEIWKQIVLLKKSNITEDETLPPTINVDVTHLEKDDRATLHEIIKLYFRCSVVSNTEDIDGKKVIVLKKSTGPDRFYWPIEEKFVHFLVYKEGLDTIQTVQKIAHSLHKKPSLFSYAGVKDRRAKTTQWFCVKQLSPSFLLYRAKSLSRVKIGNFRFKHHGLRLGDLTGNRFRIALRNIEVDDDKISVNMDCLKRNGFINYYGLQRFGADKEVPTYLVGLHLLLGQFQKACDLILKLKKSDDPESTLTKAKKVYVDTRDAKAAYDLLGYDDVGIEASLLKGLTTSGKNNYVQALESVPRNMRLMYIHAYQSLIWNKVVSKRIKEFGTNIKEGDMVLVSEKINENSVEDTDSISTQDDDNDQVVRQEVEKITKENIEKYTIYDVVLPLPGYDIEYPDYLMDYYKELLEADNLSLEMHQQSVKTYSLSGTYRKIVLFMGNLSWSTMPYSDPIETLIRSDFEEILKHDEPTGTVNGKYKALIMDFALPSSAYATMGLRELMRIDTSASHHASLNHKPSEDVKAGDDSNHSTNEINHVQGSLLEDKDKFEAFKSLVFNKQITNSEEHETNKDITEDAINNECELVKRKYALEDDAECAKRSKTD